MSSSDLIKTLIELDADSVKDDAERAQLVDALLKALRTVQKPWEITADHGWAQPGLIAAIKTLIDAGLWSKWVAAGGQPSHVSELAQLSGVDAPLLGMSIIGTPDCTDKSRTAPSSNCW